MNTSPNAAASGAAPQATGQRDSRSFWERFGYSPAVAIVIRLTMGFTWMAFMTMISAVFYVVARRYGLTVR